LLALVLSIAIFDTREESHLPMPSLCTAATRAEADLAQEPSPGLRELFECKEGSCLGMGQPHHLWATLVE